MNKPTTRGLFALLLALAALVGCAQDDSRPRSETRLVEPENALSEELMLTLSQAKNFHHKADVLLDDGKVDDAAREIERVFTLPFPEGAPEAEDVLLDSYARLAKLRLGQDRLDEADALVDKGMSMKTRDSFFLANLYTVRGEIFEARAHAAEGDVEAQNEAKRSAIEAFDHSIRINQGLLEALREGDRE
jgi:hypothetical protein